MFFQFQGYKNTIANEMPLLPRVEGILLGNNGTLNNSTPFNIETVVKIFVPDGVIPMSIYCLLDEPP